MMFAGMILCHLLYDVHWQTPFIAQHKGTRWFPMLLHTLTWGLFVSVPLWYFGAFTWVKLVLLVVSHALVDRWKSRQPRDDAHWHLMYVDQGLHVASLIGAALL